MTAPPLESTSTAPARPATSPLPLAAVAVVLAGAAGWLAARQFASGDAVVALMLVPYLLLLVGVLWLSRGNLPVVVAVAYLVAPVPADNLLPQVFIFPTTDFALRGRDLFFLADLLLLAALATMWWRRRECGGLTVSGLARYWLLGMAVLAVYPVIIGVWFGAGQSVEAVAQGAAMPLRAVGVVLLVVAWTRTHGWDATVRALARTLVVCGVVLAATAVAAMALAHGRMHYSLFGYPLVVDRRPAVPGWGNNILANYLCLCVAVLVFLRHRLRWGVRVVVVLAGVLVVGLAFTEVRIAMILALVLVEVPVVLAVLRWAWPRRGALLAGLAAAVTAFVLGLVTVTVLPLVNPRFTTLTPGLIGDHLPADGSAPDRTSFDAESGVDLGGESLSTRSGLLRTATDVWLREPVLGVGWNGWGWAKSEEDPRQVIAIDPHNGFAWHLAETGVVGLLLLYLLPVLTTLRRWHVWWLWAVPAVATALEMVNPNLRNGHFAVAVWALLALGFAATDPVPRYTIRRWLLDCLNWTRGGPVRPDGGA